MGRYDPLCGSHRRRGRSAKWNLPRATGGGTEIVRPHTFAAATAPAAQILRVGRARRGQGPKGGGPEENRANAKEAGLDPRRAEADLRNRVSRTKGPLAPASPDPNASQFFRPSPAVGPYPGPGVLPR